MSHRKSKFEINYVVQTILLFPGILTAKYYIMICHKTILSIYLICFQ